MARSSCGMSPVAACCGQVGIRATSTVWRFPPMAVSLPVVAVMPPSVSGMSGVGRSFSYCHILASHGVMWSAEGQLFASGDDEGNIRLWTVDQTEPAVCVQDTPRPYRLGGCAGLCPRHQRPCQCELGWDGETVGGVQRTALPADAQRAYRSRGAPGVELGWAYARQWRP